MRQRARDERVAVGQQPVLVVMDYRGGDRLRRCLASISPVEHRFSRIIVSVTADPVSEDILIVQEYLRFAEANGLPSRVELLCTGRELPTMEHQRFWVDYLESTGCQPTDWILWLAYDDELRPKGIDALVDEDGAWPLIPGSAYFGPWAMRHERADALWSGDRDAPVESWTSFPLEGPLRCSVASWIGRQLEQPTYLQMSGSLCQFSSFLELRDGHPRKRGPMRIEMAAAATTPTREVAELPEPIVIIYGRPDSDRASYGRAARREDRHLFAWLLRYAIHRPAALGSLLGAAVRVTGAYVSTAIGRRHREVEAWVVRGEVLP